MRNKKRMTEKERRSKTLNFVKFRLLGVSDALRFATDYMEQWEGGGGGENHELYQELRMIRVKLGNFTEKFREKLK